MVASSSNCRVLGPHFTVVAIRSARLRPSIATISFNLVPLYSAFIGTSTMKIGTADNRPGTTKHIAFKQSIVSTTFS